jgi:hypothetical protein
MSFVAFKVSTEVTQIDISKANIPRTVSFSLRVFNSVEIVGVVN